MKALKLKVYGRVQGVNFRNTTKDFCDKNKISGYVINNEDGSVSIFAQGSEKGLKDFVSWIDNDPGVSKVAKIKKTECKPDKQHTGFVILRDRSLFKDQKMALRNLSKSLNF